jgi:hypothetical protein
MCKGKMFFCVCGRGALEASFVQVWWDLGALQPLYFPNKKTKEQIVANSLHMVWIDFIFIEYKTHKTNENPHASEIKILAIFSNYQSSLIEEIINRRKTIFFKFQLVVCICNYVCN